MIILQDSGCVKAGNYLGNISFAQESCPWTFMSAWAWISTRGAWWCFCT